MIDTRHISPLPISPVDANLGVASNFTRRGLVASVLGGVALPLITGACSLFERSATIRYRMIVEVSTPAGLRTGSSVIESTITMRRTFSDPRAIGFDVRGEGVAVKLSTGTLFALLHNSAMGYDYPTYLFNNALSHNTAIPPLSRRYKAWEWMEESAEARRVKPTVVLQPVDYPTLVHFLDPSDITSMEVVDPEDLAITFGPGVKLRRILLQVTEAPVNYVIRDRLPDIRNPRFSSWRMAFPQSDVRRHLTGHSFSREEQ